MKSVGFSLHHLVGLLVLHLFLKTNKRVITNTHTNILNAVEDLMVKGGDNTYIADDSAVLLNLVGYRRVMGQRVASRHEVLVGLLVPGLKDLKKLR